MNSQLIIMLIVVSDLNSTACAISLVDLLLDYKYFVQ